jgi:hypothetical protein
MPFYQHDLQTKVRAPQLSPSLSAVTPLCDRLNAVIESCINCLYMRFICRHQNMQSTRHRVMDDISQTLVMWYGHYVVFNLSAFRGFMSASIVMKFACSDRGAMWFTYLIFQQSSTFNFICKFVVTLISSHYCLGDVFPVACVRT